jgi:hypothetical protein
MSAGAIAGARSARGNSLPAASMSMSGGVRGVTVKSTERPVRDESSESAASMSGVR